MKNRHILVVGSVNMDLMLRCQHLPGAGETVLGLGFTTAPGGKGANQAVAAARLGAKVAFVGCVGDDVFGQTASDALQGEGIDAQFLTVEAGAATGVAMVITDGVGENCIALAPGANSLLSPRHIDAARSLFAGASMLVCQLESPLATVRHAIDMAVAHGLPVLLNPAPSQALPADLLGEIDWLIPNAGEVAALVGVGTGEQANPAECAESLRRAGAKNVLVTLGSAGILAVTTQGIFERPAPIVCAVDTTGAGDTFVGAFAAARFHGDGLSVAIDFAQRAAAFSVTRRGAQASMPRMSDLRLPTASPNPSAMTLGTR